MISLHHHCTTKMFNRVIFYCLLVAPFFILTAVIIILYIKIAILVRSKVNADQTINQMTQNSKTKSEYKVTKMMVWVLGCYFLFYMPAIIISPLISHDDSDGFLAVRYLAFFFWYNNSWLNVSIYATKTKQF